MIFLKKSVTIWLALFFSTAAFAESSDRVLKWQEDIDHYFEAISTRHINPFHSVSKEHFKSELDRLSTQLTDFSDAQIIFELMRITQLINDGHTQFPLWGSAHKRFPFKFRLFDNGLYLTTTSEQYKHHLGTGVVAVGGVPIDQIIEKIKIIAQGVENEFALKEKIANYLSYDNLLTITGHTQKPGSTLFSFQHNDQSIKPVEVMSLPKAEADRQMTVHFSPRTAFETRTVSLSDNLWLSVNTKVQSAYMYFKSYPSYEEIYDFGAQVRAELESQKIRNLIIDLRDNRGGSFFRGLALASKLINTDSLDWENGIYVLMGRETYSAAMSNAVQYRQVLNATLVGEPTGANPSGYQELGTFQLPNSNWTVTYSKRLYRFQEMNTAGVQPDIFVKQTTEAFLNRIDLPLKWIMDDIRQRSGE